MTSRIEYRVRQVNRYIVTRYEEGHDHANVHSADMGTKGEYENSEDALEVARALAKAECETLGWSADDERVLYPEFPDTEPEPYLAKTIMGREPLP